ncbi:MAG: helix-turn-helix transcriptional regulator [Spirochaetaceae bacterium]|jgi:putative molybdopterin biosynthesis protein|nr:helix-turn-helix transcriptional regulator [Spirochaetaceae bacterium]
MESSLLTAEDVARQLRIKKYTVYELIKRGELPSSKVGKQVRISQADIDCYLQASKSGPPSFAGSSRDGGEESAPGTPGRYASGTRFPGAQGENPPHPAASLELPEAPPGMVIISGQDVCLDLFLTKIAEDGKTGVLRSYMGCYNSLFALYHGRVTLAAAHLWDRETDTYNYPFIRRLLPGLPVGVFRLAGRRQGLYVRKGNPLGVTDWKDFARSDVAMINREKGCGTRILLDQKLAGLGIRGQDIRGYNREMASHLACAGEVARGGADAGCGCERWAENIAGIEFIPLQLEWYDFVFRLADKDTPAVQSVLSFGSSREFRQNLEMMGGYDLSQTGHYEEF